MNKLRRHFGLSDSIGKVANMLDNLHMKPGDKISTYNVDFMRYASQLGWGNSVLCHRYYQRLPNQIQDPISTREQGKPTSFQNMYTLVITINYRYWEHDCGSHCTRQAVKNIDNGLQFLFLFLFFILFTFLFHFSFILYF